MPVRITRSAAVSARVVLALSFAARTAPQADDAVPRGDAERRPAVATKTIGVVGGLGPQATMDFEARLHRAAQRVIPPRLNGGYPPTVVWYCRHPPVLIKEDGVPVLPLRADPRLLEAARRLGQVADFLVIPSNTPHALQPDIERAAGRFVVSTIGATIDEVRRRKWKRVGIVALGQPVFYTEPFGRLGVACETLDGPARDALDPAIFRVMEGREGDPDKAAARAAVQQSCGAGTPTTVTSRRRGNWRHAWAPCGEPDAATDLGRVRVGIALRAGDRAAVDEAVRQLTQSPDATPDGLKDASDCLLGLSGDGLPGSDAALDLLDRAAALAEDSPARDAVAQPRFKALLARRDYPAAYAVAREIADAPDASAPVLNELAWTIAGDPALQRRDLDLAQRMADRAVALTESRNPNYLDTYARVMYEKGDAARAVDLQQQAVKLADRPEFRAPLDRYRAKLAPVR